jgi:ATP-dependent RNA helicase DeaD
VEVAPVPTVADLKAARVEQVQEQLRATILDGGLEEWRRIVAGMAAEFDPMDIAAAALKQGASSTDEETEIPTGPPPREKHPARAREDLKKARTIARGAKGGGKGGGMTKLYVGAGRKLKVRPGDLVGAIANEAGIDAATLGTITIFDRHSLVEVPSADADTVLRAMAKATIKGKKILVRRDREG